jgi:hypothetical protein
MAEFETQKALGRSHAEDDAEVIYTLSDNETKNGACHSGETN